MKYREEKDLTNVYKEDYVKGLELIVEKLQKKSEVIRSEYSKNIFIQQEEYRNELKKMLGWPLVNYCADKVAEVKSELLSVEDGYEIYRMRFEILDGLNMTGLFFKQNGEDKKPLVIVQHGGYGTPERISGIYGDTVNYNDMLQRVRANGVHVFAPQLLLWSKDQYDVDFDRRDIDNRLKRVGSSITAIEIFGITRILDYFEREKYVSSFGMVGLSYGGFYTLYTTAIDTRIKSAISCSYFNKRDVIGWSDWTWFKSAEKFDDAEVACLVYPRKLHIEIGDNDELFDYKYGVESFEKLKEMCEKVGTEWVSFKVFNGVHEFFKDDTPIQKLVNDIKK
ncbi:MAG: hypothetical protein IKA17_09910 [Clostridia bacterium]|nr:hypothetical protein [Clostridia bacterium]